MKKIIKDWWLNMDWTDIVILLGIDMVLAMFLVIQYLGGMGSL